VHALLADHILKCEKRGEYVVSRMPPKCQGTKQRQTETESEASPENITDNHTNSATLNEDRWSNGESGTQADSSRGSTSDSSKASSSGKGTPKSTDSGTM